MNPEEFDYSIETLMTEDVYDKYEEKGKIIKIHDLLLFQPSISEYEYINSEERRNPTVRKTSFKLGMETIYTKPDIGETFKNMCELSLDRIKQTSTYDKLKTYYKKNSFWQTIKNEDELYKLIIESQFETLNVSDQLKLLNMKDSDIYKQTIYDVYVLDDMIVLNNTTENDGAKTGKLETYKLIDGEWEHSDNRTDPIIKKHVGYFGYINMVAQDRRFKKPQFTIGIVDEQIKNKLKKLKDLNIELKEQIKSTKEQIGRTKMDSKTELTQMDRTIEIAKGKLTKHPTLHIIYKELAKHMKENNIYDDIHETDLNLNVFLELYFRYLERTDTDTKYFYYKSEINQVKSQLKI